MQKRRRSLVCGSICVLGLASFHTNAATVSFTGATNTDFNTATNWSDNLAPTANGDVRIVESSKTADFNGGSTTISGIMVGDASAGTVNVNSGTLNVTLTGGFPAGFALGGHLSNHTGLGIVNIKNGAAVNMTVGTGGIVDSGFVGERADGALNIAAGGTFTAPTVVWRVGQFGGFYGAPPAFTGSGSINVQGTWSTGRVFLAPSGGAASLTISGNGSVTLETNLDMRGFAGQNVPFRSAVVTMVGSNAKLDVNNVIGVTADVPTASDPHNKFTFIADAGGVSKVTARTAMSFQNMDITVDLTQFPMSFGQSIVLFDTPPDGLVNGQTFGNLTIIGGQPGGNYSLINDDVATGDVLLNFSVPEPSSAALLGMFAVGAVRRRRNA